MIKIFTNALVLLGVCIAIHPYGYGDRMPFEEYLENELETLRTEDTYLRELYAQHLKVLYHRHVSRDAYFNDVSMRSPQDNQYILDALWSAYKQEPKDWGTVAVTLELAVAGTNDEEVVQLCVEILRNIKTVPDDGWDVACAAAQYLLVKRGTHYVDLIASCVYAEVVGVEDINSIRYTPTRYNIHLMPPNVHEIVDRNRIRHDVLVVLLRYLSREEQMPVLEKLKRDHPLEEAKPSTWQHSISRIIRTAKQINEEVLSGELVLEPIRDQRGRCPQPR